jgi:hypothetical protein
VIGFKGLRLGGAVAGVAAALMMALAGAAAPSTAKADVTWFVRGTFDDGGKLDGHFTIDVWGYLLNNYDLVTTGGSTLPGHDYNPSDSQLYISNGALWIDFEPQYYNDLNIQFVGDLNTPSANNPIDGGWECANSWLCFVHQFGPTRYFTGGFASTDLGAIPEPSVWATLILGMFGVGTALRFARRGRRAASVA